MPLDQPLDRDLELLAGPGVRDGGHGDDVVGHVPGRGLGADRGLDRRDQVTGQLGSRSQHDEQCQPVPPVAELGADHQRLRDLRELVHDGVNVRAPQPHAVAVKSGIRTT